MSGRDGESDDCPRCGWPLKPSRRGYLECRICGWRRPGRRTLKQHDHEHDEFERRHRMWGSMLAYRYVTGGEPP